jgi:hypothetical protein
LWDHLEFMSTVGKLMQNPPILILLGLDAPGLELTADEAARGLADETLRHFFAREHFVARAGETLVAAALPATDIDSARSGADGTLAALMRAGVAPDCCAGGLATLVPGEAASDWWQRCHSGLLTTPWAGHCTIAAVPAVFD